MKFFTIFFTLACDQFVNSGYIYEKGLGSDCLYDEDCITRNSFCKGNKICACKIGYQYDPGSDICFPKEINLKCIEDYDCSGISNAECRYGKCQCKYDHVPSREKSLCLPTMRLTSNCEEDIQCNSVMEKSYCDHAIKHCVCERGLRQDMKRMICLQEIKLHDKCQETAECEVNEELKGKVVCKPTEYGSGLLGYCECAEGFVEKDNKCVIGGSSQATLSVSAMILLLIVKWVL